MRFGGYDKGIGRWDRDRIAPAPSWMGWSNVPKRRTIDDPAIKVKVEELLRFIGGKLGDIK